MRVPRELKDLTLRVDRAVGDLTRERGHEPSVDEIAHALGIEPEGVLDALQAAGAYRATSLDAPGDDDDHTASLADTTGTAEPGYTGAEHRAVLQPLMRCLTLREQKVLRLRIQHDLTQAQIGERVGVSQMQVSRIVRGAIARLRILAEGRT
jgi:RNA polymerase sigma-B factor